MRKRQKDTSRPPLPSKAQVTAAYLASVMLVGGGIYYGLLVHRDPNTTTVIPTSVAMFSCAACFGLWGGLSHYYRRHPNMFDEKETPKPKGQRDRRA